MRRERRELNSSNLLDRILVDKVEEIGAGLWLPTEFRTQFFRTFNGTNAIEREIRIRVLRCALNTDVPEATFTAIHRPGSIRYQDRGQFTHQFTQVSAGGEDLLDGIVNFMVRYSHLPSKPFGRSHPYLWLVTGMVCGFSMALVYTLRRPSKCAVDSGYQRLKTPWARRGEFAPKEQES